MERAQRLYDCITEVSDQYIQEAESFEIRQGKILNIDWKRWGCWAAALVVVVGVGLAVREMGVGSADSTSAAMSEPAASAPAAAENPTQSQSAATGSPENAGAFSDTQHTLNFGAEIRLSQAESYVILTPEQAEHLGLPENLEEAVVGDAVTWLVLEDGVYVPSEEPTEMVLYPCAPDLYIVRAGAQFYVAAVKGLP